MYYSCFDKMFLSMVIDVIRTIEIRLQSADQHIEKMIILHHMVNDFQISQTEQKNTDFESDTG